MKWLFGIGVLLTIGACGGEKMADGKVLGLNLPPAIELNAPDYAIAGQPFQLLAQVSDPEGETITGRWQQSGSVADYFFDLDSSDLSLDLEASVTLSKSHDPEQDRASYRFIATDASGNSTTAAVNLSVYDAPLNVGYPLTLKAARPVQLVMQPDAEFEREVAGTFDSFSWTQVDGPAVTLVGANTYAAEFMAPEVAEITRLTFLAEAKASSSGFSVSAEKVIYLVPSAEWVDAVAIHHTDHVSAVLRADGSLLILQQLEPVEFIPESSEAEGVVDLNGSHHSVGVLYRDGTALTLYSTGNKNGVVRDYFQGFTDIKEISGSRSVYDFASRESFKFLTNAGDLYDSDGSEDPRMIDSGLAEISSHGLGGYRLTTAGNLEDDAGAIVLGNVLHASGEAYLLQDGTVGHLTRELPSHIFPDTSAYVDVVSGAAPCYEVVFALKKDGSVDGFTPYSNPVPPELTNITMLKAGCQAHMALDAQGVVFLWPGTGISSEDPSLVLLGEAPSVVNLKAPRDGDSVSSF